MNAIHSQGISMRITAGRLSLNRTLLRPSNLAYCSKQVSIISNRSFNSTSIKKAQDQLNIRGLIYDQNGDPRELVRGHQWTIERKGLEKGQILIKIGLASLNPADINVIQGVYPAKPEKQSLQGLEEPVFVGGNEGFGIVEEVSGGIEEKGQEGGEKEDSRKLKKGDWVVFGKPQIGVWKSHLICNEKDVIKINSKESTKDGKFLPLSPVMASTLQVNPATAYCMLHNFTNWKSFEGGLGSSAIIQNAANSAVGQAVAQISSRRLKIPSINLVRDRKDFASLKKQFDSYALPGKPDTKAHLFTYESLRDRQSGAKEEIKEILGKRQIRLGLNALCGKDAENMTKFLAPNAKLITYGAMSKQPLSIPAGLIIFQDVSVHGFMMNRWYAENPLSERQNLMQTLVDWYQEKVLEPPAHTIVEFSKEESVDEITNKAREAIKESMAGMGGKKVFFRFK